MEDEKTNDTHKKLNENQGNSGNGSALGGSSNGGHKASAAAQGESRSNTGQGEAAQKTVEKTEEKAGTLLEMVKTTAGDAYGAVSEKASVAISDRKSDVALGLVGVADTVRRVSGAIKEGDSQNSVMEYASTYSDTAAEKLEKAAEYFETSDLRGLTRDVESYARRNPAIFLGAAFVAGVLAARFIKSSPGSATAATV